jgi:hypothetical protein
MKQTTYAPGSYSKEEVLGGQAKSGTNLIQIGGNDSHGA